ncbi:MAG: GMC family oxidoreductase [Leptospiraceae bacterium]|nr:GMC family oxidoreductase [Leptospiraceae bacterium]
MQSPREFDFIIIGSGFGGSVSALRLAQKGYSVAVLESGKRWKASEFPETNWNLRKYLWMPKLGFYGIQRINILNNFLLVSGAGVGGGSLVYANTLYVPPDHVLKRPTFAKMGGPAGLRPYYEVASFMLGVTQNPTLFEPDRVLADVARDLGKENTFRPTEVAVYFGDGPGRKKADPFFGGEGPDRVGCNYCGGCMVGCRFDSKNTLDKNYLYLAEQLGVEIIPETKATSLKPLNEEGHPDASADGSFGYLVETRSTTGLWTRRSILKGRSVILSAGVMGSTALLQEMKKRKWLPRLSDRLGARVRTNSETVLVATRYGKKDGKSVDYSRGIAITSSIHVDEHTHVEPVRYPAGADFFGLLASPMTSDSGRIPRPLRYLATLIRHPIYFFQASNPFGFAKKSVILLVMQTLDNSVRLVRKRRLAWPFVRSTTSELEPGSQRTPATIPAGNDVTRRVAQKIGGIPRSSLNEVLLNAPVTGHIMGGCIMGESADESVIDMQNRVYPYSNLRVVDGSMITENLGVNPSLTITALAERAMAYIPPKDHFRAFGFEKRKGFISLLSGGSGGNKTGTRGKTGSSAKAKRSAEKPISKKTKQKARSSRP